MTDVPGYTEPTDLTVPSEYAVHPGPSLPPPPAAVGSPKLGKVAMIIAVSVITVSVVASVLLGVFGTTIYEYRTGTSAGFNMQSSQGWFTLQMLVGSAFGIWALVQGIVAVVKNRGRRFGIVAIVLAGAAPLVSLIVWIALGFAFGHHVQA